jgi:DNA-binding NtrC family response regulator
VSTDRTDTLTIAARIRRAGLPLIGQSEQFSILLRTLERVSRNSSATVLIRGETGTGKELIARATHYLGSRCAFPFVPVNCGALPESLAENELFGHSTGAFTGANGAAPGLVRLAEKGTLFLDEIDSLPAKAQVGLLRFLQDGHFRPLGARREEASDVRIIAASNSCIEEDVQAGRFRQDLYYRLNLLSIDIPPLRSRLGDVHVLSEYFLREYASRYSMPQKTLHAQTQQWFSRYGWPGNVRELENLLHRECLLCDDQELQIRQPRVAGEAMSILVDISAALDFTHVAYKQAKSRALEEFDRTYLTHLVQRTNGNVTKAALLAGKERRAFGKLLKRYGIMHDATNTHHQ